MSAIQPPFRFVEMCDRIDTYVVLCGSVRIGTVRHDAGSGLYVAMTTGCPDGSAPADIHRNFATRDNAAAWLSRAIDGIQPRRPYSSTRKIIQFSTDPRKTRPVVTAAGAT